MSTDAADERSQRLAQTDLSEDQSKQLLSRELDDAFFDYHKSKSKAWGTLLLEHETVHPSVLSQILLVRESGGLTREGIEQVVEQFAHVKHVSVQEIEAFADENDLVMQLMWAI